MKCEVDTVSIEKMTEKFRKFKNIKVLCSDDLDLKIFEYGKIFNVVCIMHHIEMCR